MMKRQSLLLMFLTAVTVCMAPKMQVYATL